MCTRHRALVLLVLGLLLPAWPGPGTRAEEQGAPAGAAVAPEDLLRTLEALRTGRARGGGVDLRMRAAALGNRREEIAAAQEAEARAWSAFTAARGSGLRTVWQRARQELEAARLRLADVLASAVDEVPTGSVAGGGVGIGSLRAGLADGEALVRYGVVAADVWALVVTREGAAAVDLGPASVVADRAGALDARASEETWAATTAALRTQLVEGLSLAPGTRRILRPADDALAGIPFALLVPDREVVWTLPGPGPALAPPGRGVLAIAPSDAGDGVPGRRPLPKAQEEARAVGSDPLLGRAASEAAVRGALARAGRWRAVHFAGHVLVDSDSPFLDALLLAQDPANDGRLTALEVLQTGCPADLVVLSTGPCRADGLPRAFLDAGAGAVLFCPAPVDDAAACALFVRFHELYGGPDGQAHDAPGALRRAQDHVRGQDRWRHPRFWAGWSLLVAGTAQPLTTRVRIETEFGAIEAEVDLGRAPRTATNFLRYVQAGLYDGARFHRTVKPDNQPQDDVRIEVVQAGLDPAREGEAFPPIPLERTSVTGLAHRDGTISMARAGPDTATSEFFLCLGDQPALDFGGSRNADGQGFAAFGRVTAGMDVVRRIQQSSAHGQTLTPPIRILSIRTVPEQSRLDSAR